MRFRLSPAGWAALIPVAYMTSSFALVAIWDRPPAWFQVLEQFYLTPALYMMLLSVPLLTPFGLVNFGMFTLPSTAGVMVATLGYSGLAYGTARLSGRIMRTLRRQHKPGA